MSDQAWSQLRRGAQRIKRFSKDFPRTCQGASHAYRIAPSEAAHAKSRRSRLNTSLGCRTRPFLVGRRCQETEATRQQRARMWHSLFLYGFVVLPRKIGVFAQSALSSLRRSAERVPDGIRPLIVMLVTGSILIWVGDYCDMYTISRIAALLHLLGALTKWKKQKWNLFLIVAFALYSIVLTHSFGRHPLLKVLLLGGIFESVRRILTSDNPSARVFSSGVPILILAVSFSVTEVPNVVFCDRDSAAIQAEYAHFFFRGVGSEDAAPQNHVVIWQEPPPSAFPFSLRFSFCGPHSIFWSLPLSMWPTLKYQLGEVPEVRITDLRSGHGRAGESTGPVCNDDLAVAVDRHGKNILTPFHRVYGEFHNLPEGNGQLHLRVLVMPKKKVMRLFDKITHRWYVQPHTLDSDAELHLEYDSDSKKDGVWCVDAFFGAPQDLGDAFEIMVVVTTTDLKRDQVLRPDDPVVQSRVQDRLTVYRDD